jgi:hypothetical protein
VVLLSTRRIFVGHVGECTHTLSATKLSRNGCRDSATLWRVPQVPSKPTGEKYRRRRA